MRSFSYLVLFLLLSGCGIGGHGLRQADGRVCPSVGGSCSNPSPTDVSVGVEFPEGTSFVSSSITGWPPVKVQGTGLAWIDHSGMKGRKTVITVRSCTHKNELYLYREEILIKGDGVIRIWISTKNPRYFQGQDLRTCAEIHNKPF